MVNKTYNVKSTEVVGYSHNGDVLCPKCYKLSIKDVDLEEDVIAMLFTPIFAGSEHQSQSYCDGCNEEIEYLTILDEIK